MEGIITYYADPEGQTPLYKMHFSGTSNWGNPHPIAEGAFNVKYVLEDSVVLTPLSDSFTTILNS